MTSMFVNRYLRYIAAFKTILISNAASNYEYIIFVSACCFRNENFFQIVEASSDHQYSSYNSVVITL